MTDPRPPQSTETERYVLGAILKDGSILNELLGLIPHERVFYSPRHREIYGAMLAMLEANEPVDLATVADELSRYGKLDACGGRSYLVELAEQIVTTANAETHANIVAEKAQYRNLIHFCQQMMNSCYSQSAPVETLAADFSQQLSSSVSLRRVREMRKIGSYTMPVMEECEAVQTGSGKVGLKWGYSDLDRLTGGAQKGELITVSGRPRMGKTSWIDCVSSRQAMEGHRVAVFSAETKGNEWVLRTLCSLSRIDSMRLKRGETTSEDWEKLTRYSAELQKWNYWLNDTPEIDIHDLILQATRLYNDVGIEIVYVDYLQKLACRGEFRDERLKFNYMVRKMKRLAQDLDIPVVIASQLNRNLETRQNKRPNLGDLKETGAIEEESDLIGALHRPSLYVKKGKEPDSKNLCEWIILKQRNGPVDVVDLHYNPMFTRFEDMGVAQPQMPF